MCKGEVSTSPAKLSVEVGAGGAESDGNIVNLVDYLLQVIVKDSFFT